MDESEHSFNLSHQRPLPNQVLQFEFNPSLLYDRNESKNMTRKIGMVGSVVSGVLISAHFLRMEILPLVVLGLVFPWLTLIKNVWATRMVQILLALAAAEWVRTLVGIARQRQDLSQPWFRMAVILGFVACFTAGSAFLIRFRKAGVDDGIGRLNDKISNT